MSPKLFAAALSGTVIFSTLAHAQTSSPASSIPVRPAIVIPIVGEEVLDQNGAVASPYFIENRICARKDCRTFIFDVRNSALINNDGMWSSAYGRTGRGEQVIRVLPFTTAENPRPAPDDTPLETAPAIIKVSRPNASN